MDRPLPFWFPLEELETLSTFLRQEHLTDPIVNDLRLELDVSRMRVKLLSIDMGSLSKALGYTNAVPIYLNSEEKIFLLNSKDLPTNIKERIK